ncbi:hypothetical protein [uncultured Fibrobacter sp.]|uniref:hypothetical protein n=1 Tax=uncultured Fibrobacter sp. TaxID=261512 RepID=UPI002625C5A6|nr:hypothetical protein [uncultured Fibrobacter sp.]
MKKSIYTRIIAATLLFASFTFAQLDQTGNETKSTVDKTDYYYHAHDGIYFATVFTFAYESLSKHYERENWGDEGTDDISFKGWIPPLIEARLGAYYLNVAGIYGTFAFGLGTGDIEDTYRNKEDDYERTEEASATTMRMLLGLGADFYPLQDKESLLYGLFFGLCGGFAFEAAEITSEYHFQNSDETFHNFFGRVEAGYDWWFCTRWRVGASFNYTFGGFMHTESPNNDYSGSRKEEQTTTSHTFGLAIRIAH